MVSATASVSPNTIRALYHRPRSAKPSELRYLALKADRLTELVQNRWSELAAPLREQLKGLAYGMLDEERLGVVAGLRERMLDALLVLMGDGQALALFAASVGRLTEAVLDAVERTDSTYKSQALQAVQGALVSAHPAESADDFARRLDALSDKTTRTL